MSSILPHFVSVTSVLLSFLSLSSILSSLHSSSLLMVTSSERVRSTLECATSCSRHPGCWLFNHNTEDLRCHLLQASWRDHAVVNHKLWRHGRIKGEQENTSILTTDKMISSLDRGFFYHCIWWNKFYVFLSSSFCICHFGSIVFSFHKMTSSQDRVSSITVFGGTSLPSFLILHLSLWFDCIFFPFLTFFHRYIHLH